MHCRSSHTSLNIYISVCVCVCVCVWNKEATRAFSLLKNALNSTLVLATLDFGKTFIVECDES